MSGLLGRGLDNPGGDCCSSSRCLLLHQPNALGVARVPDIVEVIFCQSFRGGRGGASSSRKNSLVVSVPLRWRRFSSCPAPCWLGRRSRTEPPTHPFQSTAAHAALRTTPNRLPPTPSDRKLAAGRRHPGASIDPLGWRRRRSRAAANGPDHAETAAHADASSPLPSYTKEAAKAAARAGGQAKPGAGH